MIIQLLSYFGIVLGFLFLTLAIASALYYISEIVEEHSEPTRRFLSRAIYSVIGLLLLLVIFDGFPIKLTIFSIVSHVVYYQNLRTFPVISLTSASFLGSCICVVVNHYLWFKHFNEYQIPPQFRYDPNYIPRKRSTFSEVASFFGICVWMIPFALFVSLSAGDYVLPTTMHAKKNDSGEMPRLSKKAGGLARLVIDGLRDYIGSIAKVFGYKGSQKTGSLVV